MTSSLDRLFNPRGIALIGASPDLTKLAARPQAYLRRYGFAGQVYPVNPKYGEIAGDRCYASPADLPDGVDLALILTAASGVGDALEACGKRGIPFAISIAGGFAEAGDHAEQRRLEAICARYGIRLVGPNCVGLLEVRNGLTATFSSALKQRLPRPGSTVLLTQSGALGNALVQSFNEADVGLTCWVSTGNEVSLGVLDLLEHFIAEPDVRLIVLFIEGLKEGERLLPLARRARAHGKTIVALRAGYSKLGRAASISHTGKLAGPSKVWRHVARQAGIIHVDSLDDIVDLAVLFDVAGSADAGDVHGIGVLTASGGQGVMIADSAQNAGVPLPAFAVSTQEYLRTILPPQMPVANPVDTALFAGLAETRCCAEAVLDDPHIGTLLLTISRLVNDYDELLPWLTELAARARAAGKLLAITYLSSSDRMKRPARHALQRAGAFVLPTQQRVVAALGRRMASAAWQAPVLEESARDVELESSDRNAAGFIARAGIPVAPERLCATIAEARTAAAEIGYPVVLKVVSPDIAHKTEVGGVALNLVDEHALGHAWTAMADSLRRRAATARIDGFAMHPYLTGGFELIVGCSIDPELGKVVMMGSGGIWAEVIDDIGFVALPASRDEIRAVLLGLRIAPILDGARGMAALDVDAAVDSIARLAQAYQREAWVGEVDINPLLVRPRGLGVVALDVLVVAQAGHHQS